MSSCMWIERSAHEVHWKDNRRIPMAYLNAVVCRECNTQFQVRIGDTMIAYTLHCDLCGRYWFLRMDEIPESPQSRLLEQLWEKYDSGEIEDPLGEIVGVWQHSTE